MRLSWCCLLLAAVVPGAVYGQGASGLSGNAQAPSSTLSAPATPATSPDPLSPVARPLRQHVPDPNSAQVQAEAGIKPQPPETPLDVKSHKLDREIRRGICTGC